MSKGRPDEKRPTVRERFVDAGWSVGTSFVSGVLLLTTAWVFGEVTGVTDRILDRQCSDYDTQAAAQADFEENEDELGSLDRDGDGIACEALR